MDVVALAGQYGWAAALILFIVVAGSPTIARCVRSVVQRQWYKEDFASTKQIELYERLLKTQQTQHDKLLTVIEQNTDGYNNVIVAIEENTSAVNEIREAFKMEVIALADAIRNLTTQVADLSRRVTDLEGR